MPKLIKQERTLLFCKDSYGLLNVENHKLLFYARISCYSDRTESKLNIYSPKFEVRQIHVSLQNPQYRHT